MPIFKLVLLALVAYLSKAGSPGKDVYPVLNPEVSVDFASGSKQSVAPLTSELTITANHTNESEIPQKRAAEHQHENEEILEHKQQTEEPIYDSELKDMFDKFDEDSNGYLNRKEMIQYFLATTPADTEPGKRLRQNDYFNLVRYRQFCKNLNADPLLGLSLENIKLAYQYHYGKPHTDWVVTAGLKSLKLRDKEKKHLKAAFTHFDSDNNGFLNWPEMKKLVPAMRPEEFENLVSALEADLSEGVDLRGVLKAYTHKKGRVREAVRKWEEPPEDVIIVHDGSPFVVWLLAAFFVICLLAPICVWLFGIHKTVQGRKVVKKAARQMQEIARVE